MWDGLLTGLRRVSGGDEGKRRAAELAEIEAEITSFGEALDKHAFSPRQPGATDEMRADLGRALDAYEEAKRAFAGDRNRADALDVLRVLDEGRHALACLDARLAGDPLPARLPLCFFDVRHGPAATQIRWAPENGVPRNISVCAADAVRIADSRKPSTRQGRGSAVSRPRATVRGEIVFDGSSAAVRGDRAVEDCAEAGGKVGD